MLSLGLMRKEITNRYLRGPGFSAGEWDLSTQGSVSYFRKAVLNRVAMNLHSLQCCVPSISPQGSQGTVTLVSYLGHQRETSCHEPELKMPLISHVQRFNL